MSDVKNILVTGGAGFIGSHTCVELLQAGYGVVIIDDLSNSCEKAVNRIAQIVKQAEADGKAPVGASGAHEVLRGQCAQSRRTRAHLCRE